eukprot:CAMPEP_0114510084 /NCGR_PEP_ID=MMETSP0109-20121206/13584_1 /TAXON_ID=29199 /ORGANISM="Chlorarachnion reptans, Strain CCCM449" /LENGTH=698 /DNA_ID=CAMNT_0001689339 /DNA_START=110 /DNA_END=2203 /DNA_ORIENTATION=-
MSSREVMDGALFSPRKCSPDQAGQNRSVWVRAFIRMAAVHIREQRFGDAIRTLRKGLAKGRGGRDKVLMTLIGHCYYHKGDFVNASHAYTVVCALDPKSFEERKCLAQCYVRLDNDQRAIEECRKIPMRYYFRLGMADLFATLLERGSILYSEIPESILCEPQILIAQALQRFRSGKYGDALRLMSFVPPKQMDENDHYLMAVCHYGLKRYKSALALVNQMLQSRKNGKDISTKARCLNMKCAILYQIGNETEAKEVLQTFYESLNEPDPVTWHNVVLFHAPNQPQDAMQDWLQLAEELPYPSLSNLVLFCARSMEFDRAVDILQDNKSLWEHVPQELREVVEIILSTDSDPEVAGERLGEFAEELDKIHGDIQNEQHEIWQSADWRFSNGTAFAREEAVVQYLPILMSYAKLRWDDEEFETTEMLFEASAKYCLKNKIWRTNLAHVLFAQERYEASASLYKEIWDEAKKDGILSVQAIIPANLAVSYVMTNQNKRAEEIASSLELNLKQTEEGNGVRYHLIVLYLVLGTLYCSKKRFTFGIRMNVLAYQSCKDSLDFDIWHYMKRCILAFLEELGKGTLPQLEASTAVDLLAAFLQDLQYDLRRKTVSGTTLVSEIVSDDVPSEQYAEDIDTILNEVQFLGERLYRYSLPLFMRHSLGLQVRRHNKTSASLRLTVNNELLTTPIAFHVTPPPSEDKK